MERHRPVGRLARRFSGQEENGAADGCKGQLDNCKGAADDRKDRLDNSKRAADDGNGGLTDGEDSKDDDEKTSGARREPHRRAQAAMPLLGVSRNPKTFRPRAGGSRPGLAARRPGKPLHLRAAGGGARPGVEPPPGAGRRRAVTRGRARGTTRWTQCARGDREPSGAV